MASGFLGDEEAHMMSDLLSDSPATDADYACVHDRILERQEAWDIHLATGLAHLADHLDVVGYVPIPIGIPPGRFPGVEPGTVLVSWRLKNADAIVAKMRQFGWLRFPPDIWGYRLVVPSTKDLVPISTWCTGLWDTPASGYQAVNAYDRQISSAHDHRQTDKPIHVIRQAPWGRVEIQVMSGDFYRRVHYEQSDVGRPVSRRQFVLGLLRRGET